MPYNAAGLANPFAINQFSLHATNPGVGANPAGGSELVTAPYARKSVTLSAPVAGVASPVANTVFDLSTASDQNVQFVGIWEGATYKGYFIPATPYNFNTAATARTYTVLNTATFSITNV